jgi:DNA-binding NtrC family response regulator
MWNCRSPPSPRRPRSNVSSILIVDGESGIRDAQGVLDDEAFVPSKPIAGYLSFFAGEETFQVVLLDVWMPGMDGLGPARFASSESAGSHHDFRTQDDRNGRARD